MTEKNTSLCDSENSILVVIDMQTRLMAAMPEEARDASLAQAGVLLQTAATLDIPTIITEQYPQGLGRTCPELTALQPPVCEIVTKTAFSASGVAEFDQLLAASDRRQVVLCGVEAHVCVLQTALHLHHRGLAVFVAADAACARRPANYHNALSRLVAAGIVVSNVESLLFEWLSDSNHPNFRSVSALIK